MYIVQRSRSGQCSCLDTLSQGVHESENQHTILFDSVYFTKELNLVLVLVSQLCGKCHNTDPAISKYA